jgi:hypothetical protein
MQRVGVPKNFINCLFTTLQEAVHQVRTGYGDSKKHYGGKVWLVPIHGIGQGNGAGPAIWAVVSTPLLNVLRDKGFGCEIICPLSSEYFHFVGYAFVDDRDLIQSRLQEDPEQARQQLQEAIDTWEFSLKATCGALVPEKQYGGWSVFVGMVIHGAMQVYKTPQGSYMSMISIIIGRLLIG